MDDKNSWEYIFNPDRKDLTTLPTYHFVFTILYNWKEKIWKENDHLRVIPRSILLSLIFIVGLIVAFFSACATFIGFLIDSISSGCVRLFKFLFLTGKK